MDRYICLCGKDSCFDPFEFSTQSPGVRVNGRASLLAEYRELRFLFSQRIREDRILRWI